jgi:YidC/Oxa1 family membrane protein insertase
VRPLLAAFWILDPIYDTMGRVLAFFYSVIASYGVAIALLTVTVRIFLIPLTAKQVKSQQAMQRIQPELKRLQAKHKNDRQKLNEEMMKFYKENKVNPLAGCLPILLQAPLFIVLYRLILDLSHKDGPKHVPRDSKLFTSLVESGGAMVSWGIDLSKTATSVGGSKVVLYYALIALTVATGYFQQRQMTARLPKDAVNPQMQMITKIFPIIIGVVSLSVPAGVVVYFIVSNLWQIGQQAVTFRAFPPPHAAGADKTDPPDKTAKVVKGGSKSSGNAAKAKGKGKSGSGAGGRGSGRVTPKGCRRPGRSPDRGRTAMPVAMVRRPKTPDGRKVSRGMGRSNGKDGGRGQGRGARRARSGRERGRVRGDGGAEGRVVRPAAVRGAGPRSGGADVGSAQD